MDEYEKLESELKKIYEEYIIKFRCQVSSELNFLSEIFQNYKLVELATYVQHGTWISQYLF